MTTEILTFVADDRVQDAYERLMDRGVDGAPVVDGAGAVVGMLTTDDLLVQETKLHYPTVVSLFGAYLELPSSHRHFEEDLRRAVGATVGDVMQRDVATCSEDDTLERAATLMHGRRMSRVPVTRDGQLVGIIGRSDIIRAIVTGD
jgi:CBS domain-containing protein